MDELTLADLLLIAEAVLEIDAERLAHATDLAFRRVGSRGSIRRARR
jgi:hypothetical protein